MSVPLPDPRTVRTLLVDAGGVLVRPDFGRVAGALRARGIAAEADTLAGAEARAKKEMDRPAGRAPSDQERHREYFGLVLRHAGIGRSGATEAVLAELKAWDDRYNLWSSVVTGVPAALARLGAGERRLVVVSNSNGTVRELLGRLGLLAHFTLVVDSAEEGVEKPDPRLFQIALRRIGAQPEEAAHVGDLYEADVVGARAAGVRPVLLDEADLYPEADCPRVRSLGELAAHLAGGDEAE